MPAPSLPLSAPPTTFLSTSTKGGKLFGTDGHDQLTANNQSVVLDGKGGDDTYYLFQATQWYLQSGTKVVEAPGSGIDTVVSAWSYILPANVENLTLTNAAGARYGIGNSGDNLLISGAGSDRLTTGGGNDVIYGGTGADTFTFTKQANTVSWIADFEGGIDRLNLTNHGFKTVGAVLAATEQVGEDLKISLGDGQSVMLADATAADLAASFVRVDTLSGPAARRLAFAAEFDTPLSLNTGTPETAGGIWKTSFHQGDRRLYNNHDEQVYVDPDYKGKASEPLGLNPFSVEDGILKITAAPTDPSMLPALSNVPFTSGMLTTETSFQQQYGYFEMRAQNPPGKGMFPAFWLLPADRTWPPEIDVYEQIGSVRDHVLQGVISNASPTRSKDTNTGIDMTQDFHTYGMEWTAQKLTWFIDGVQSFQVDTPADLHKPMYLIVTLAVGGNWPGRPDATVDWTKTNLLIDYIRAYDLDDLKVVLSNAVNPLDHSDSFTLPAGPFDVSETYTGAQMSIAGVAATTAVTAAYAANGDITLTNNAAWNAIKNATITSTVAHGVTVQNFTDAEVTLGDGDDTIDVRDAKRGTISSGGGQDTITIVGRSNGATENLTKVFAGDGGDVVSFTAGSLNKVALDGGTGNDSLTLAGQAVGTMLGGLGDDILTDLSTGNVTLTGGAGADIFAFSQSGKSTVTDYVDGTDQIELINIDPLLMQSTISGADTLLDLGGGASVKLVGVNLTLAELDILSRLEGGAGNDKFTLAGQTRGIMLGGLGDDILTDLSTGDVTLTGGAGADIFAFSQAGTSTVTDYVDGTDQIKLINIDPLLVQSTISGADTLLDLGGGASVKLVGVNLTLAELDILSRLEGGAGNDDLKVVLSNAVNPLDHSDSFTLPAGLFDVSETYTGAQMSIAGVAATTAVTAAYAANGDITLTNNAAWNAIKNATITSTVAHGVTVQNFTDAEVTLGDGDDTIDVRDAKRGTISSGGGQDTITIVGRSNGATENLTKVFAGDGGDVVSFTAGSLNKVALDGGTGNDSLTLAGQAVGTMLGGLGDDILTDLSTGNVTLTGGAGADIFAFSQSGKSTVTDYVDGTDQIELINIDPLLMQSTISGADTLLDLGGGASVKLVGVNLTLAELDILSRLEGGAGNDELTLAGQTRGIMLGGLGDDILTDLSTGDVTLTGGAGADIFAFSQSGTSTVTDYVDGTDQIELINIDPLLVQSTISGADTLLDLGGGPSVKLVGVNLTLAELDILSRLEGGAGNDELTLAGQTRGTMLGGLGDDILTDLSTGDVTLTGGAGADIFAFSRSATSTVTDYVDGTDQIELINFDPLLMQSTISGADTLLDLGGGASVKLVGVNLTLAELDILSRLEGGAGNDELTLAGQTRGTMLGGLGDDILTDLSTGDVTLTGGAGADIFAFSQAGTSTVTDYVDGTDQIKLINIDPLLVQSTISGADTLLDLGGGASVKLVGVNLTLEQLDIVYV